VEDGGKAAFGADRTQGRHRCFSDECVLVTDRQIGEAGDDRFVVVLVLAAHPARNLHDHRVGVVEQGVHLNVRTLRCEGQRTTPHRRGGIRQGGAHVVVGEGLGALQGTQGRGPNGGVRVAQRRPGDLGIPVVPRHGHHPATGEPVRGGRIPGQPTAPRRSR
jgi:hypothetical protein